MKEIRRENLRRLLASPRFDGDRAKFCQDAVITKARLSQLLDARQPFGDLAASQLCEKLGLPEGFFNRVHHTLVGEPGEYKLEQKKLTSGAMEIAALYDLIPETDLIRRGRAYSAATIALLAVVEDHKLQASELQPVDQKKQPV
jgi:hypothetical protein